jgi:hypothetical protein
VPAAVDDPTVNLRNEVPDPGAVIDFWLNAAATPVGTPETVRAIAELKPLETVVVMVLVPEDTGMIDTDAGAAAMVNAGAVAVTVSETVAV